MVDEKITQHGRALPLKDALQCRLSTFRQHDRPVEPKRMDTRCPSCGISFECTPADGPCWCTELPPLPITKDITGETCLCRHCLEERVRQQSAALHASTP
jgi:cysteine-rich CWC protein